MEGENSQQLPTFPHLFRYAADTAIRCSPEQVLESTTKTALYYKMLNLLNYLEHKHGINTM